MRRHQHLSSFEYFPVGILLSFSLPGSWEKRWESKLQGQNFVSECVLWFLYLQRMIFIVSGIESDDVKDNYKNEKDPRIYGKVPMWILNLFCVYDLH